VPVGVRIIAGRDVIGIAVGHQGRHRVRRRAVHPDFAVGVECHEVPGRIDDLVHDSQVGQQVLRDVLPVLRRGAAHRVGTDAQPGRPDRFHVDDLGQFGAVRGAIVEAHDLAGGLVVGHPGDRPEVGQQLVGAIGDPAGGIRVSGAAIGRVVLEAAIARGIVRRGDDDSVGLRPAGVLTVVPDDRPRHGRGRSVFVLAFGEYLDALGDQHLDGGLPSRQRKPVGVLADEQGTRGALTGAVLDDCLGDGRDMRFVERSIET